MTFNDFRYRYFLLSKTELRNQKTKCVKLIGKKLYDDYSDVFRIKYHHLESASMLVDVIDKKVLMVCATPDKTWLLDMDDYNFKPFKKLKVDNKIAYNQNVVRMNSIEGRIKDTYAIENVWCLIHYVTSSNKHRIVVNPNAFGKFSLFKTRDYKIHKLLEE